MKLSKRPIHTRIERIATGLAQYRTGLCAPIKPLVFYFFLLERKYFEPQNVYKFHTQKLYMHKSPMSFHRTILYTHRNFCRVGTMRFDAHV